MAIILKSGDRFCVANSVNGKIITRAGRRACFKKRSSAEADKRNTVCRNLKICPSGTTTKSLIGKRP